MAARRSTRKSPRKTATKRSSNGLLPWIAIATVLAIVGYDHWSQIRPEVTSLLEGAPATASVAAQMHPSVPAPLARQQSSARPVETLPVPPAPIPVAMPIPMPMPATSPAPLATTATTTVSESFGLCGQGTHINCVFDGSTFWVRGTKIRIADIETPTLGPARCVEEGRRANAAKLRLLSLLNAGPFVLQAGTASGDAEGGAQRRILRAGQSFGDTLVNEGLAHRRMDRPSSWCA